MSAAPAASGTLRSNHALAREVLVLAAPTTGMALLQMASQLVEAWLAARQGTAALAGWSVVLPLSLLMHQWSTGAMGGGVVAAIARALGGGRRDEAASLVQHAMAIALLAGLCFALGFSWLGAWMLQAVAGPQAAEAATGYLFWLFGAGAIPVWLANTLASVLRGAGRHALAARTLTVMWLVFPALAWLLAEPAGLRLAGIGLAFALVSWVSALVLFVTVRAGAAGVWPDWRQRLGWPNFRRILEVGAIACLLAAVANLATITVTAQLRGHGPAAVAAYGISARLEFAIIPLSFGIGAALTALVGRAVGQGDWATARRIAWVGGLMALGFTGLIGGTVSLLAAPIALALGTDAEVVRIATQALRIIGPAYGGFGIGMAMYFAAMGARRMGWPLVAGLSRFALAVGLGALLAGPLGLGLQGQFIAVAAGLMAYGVFAAAGVRPGVWRA